MKTLGRPLAMTWTPSGAIDGAAEKAAHLKSIGVIRMPQPGRHGGMEAVPSDFYETVITASRLCGSTGWVCGIVGVHPWERALCDPRAQGEIWADRAHPC